MMSAAVEMLTDATGFSDAYVNRMGAVLNYEQALECAMRIARHLREGQ